MASDFNTSPTNIISGWEDSGDPGPFEAHDESMAFPDPFAEIGGPSNGSYDLVMAVRHCIREVKEKTSRYNRRRQKAHDYFNNRYDEPHISEPWQSRKAAPRVFTVVEQFAASVTQMLERSDDWTGMKAANKKTTFFMDFLKEQLQKYFNSNKTNFHRQFYKAVKASLKNGMCHLLPLFEVDEVPKYDTNNPVDQGDVSGFGASLGVFGGSGMAGLASSSSSNKPKLPGLGKPRMRIDIIPHSCVSFDGETGGDVQRGGWKTMTQFMKKGYFRKIAPKMGYDMGAVNESLEAGFNGDWDEFDYLAELDQREDLLHNMSKTGQVKITHFFGTLYDPNDHEILVDTQYFVILNDTHVILAPTDIPFWEGEDPLVSAPLIEDENNKLEGHSPILMALDQFQLAHELANLMEDFYIQSMLGMKEVDLDLIDEFDDDFADGFYPGKTIYKRGNANPAGSAVKIVPQTQTDAGFWNYFGIFQRENSVSTMLPDSASGLPRTRGRTSNMEDARRATEGGAVMTSIFRGLEDLLLVPMARKGTYRLLQDMPTEQWKEELMEFAQTFEANGGQLTPAEQAWLGSWEQASNWTPHQRWEKLAGEIEFEIRVFSTLGDRQRLIEQITFFLQTITPIPEAMGMLQLDEFLRQAARAFDFSPSRVLKLPALGNPPGGAPQQPQGQPGAPQQAQGSIPGPNYQGLASSISTAPAALSGAGRPGTAPIAGAGPPPG